MPNAAWWIDHLQLRPHPEGGYYRRIYTAADSLPASCLPGRYDSGTRPLATAIYYLLPGDHCSRLHRLKADEIWHFYYGAGLTVHIIDEDGDYRPARLGHDPHAGQSFQSVVRAGCWFGATVDDPDTFALLGCTVTPGFDFADFELGERSSLLRQHPRHEALIMRLTRATGE
ncbi:MAG: cupin domain-containing protein [Gammaproteobacteria bacterium]|nr:cupin domain-containing protein [Gammaproteobacteria bacterium]MCP5459298.1 cupin domain-containing protein [Gammaproteobacteria bacterium]